MMNEKSKNKICFISAFKIHIKVIPNNNLQSYSKNDRIEFKSRKDQACWKKTERVQLQNTTSNFNQRNCI